MKYRLVFCALAMALISHQALATGCGRLLAGPPRLLESYSGLASAAKGLDRLPRFIAPQAMVYILDTLSLPEQAYLASILDRAVVKLATGTNVDVENALRSSGDPEMIARVIRVYDYVRELKKKHKLAVKLALQNHDGRGQLYGDLPYSAHLRGARAVMKRFDLGPKDSVLGLRVGTLLWLHDIIEDTPITKPEIEALFDQETADNVDRLSTIPKRPDLSSKERKRQTFERIRERIETMLAKLADRTTNKETSLRNFFLGQPTKIEKYRQEWPLFKEILYRPGEVPELWEHLERLLTDEAYARRVVLPGPDPK